LKPSTPVLLASVLLGFLSGRMGATAPEADQLLGEVVARLPREALRVAGELVVRRRHGLPVNRFGFEMHLDWGRVPNTAIYTVRDAFGTDLERLTVIREADGRPRFKYASGDPLETHEVPPLFDTIQSSDISWADLALTFLWWKGGEVTRLDEIRGRRCYVVEVPAPDTPRNIDPEGAHTKGTGKPYAAVRLWIDEELRMLLQAEGLDAGGGLVRKLWVKSFKKIDDRWMIKDMEVQGYPVRHRTKLSVREVTADAPL
jgi:hypothetical protein